MFLNPHTYIKVSFPNNQQQKIIIIITTASNDSYIIIAYRRIYLADSRKIRCKTFAYYRPSEITTRTPNSRIIIRESEQKKKSSLTTNDSPTFGQSISAREREKKKGRRVFPIIASWASPLSLSLNVCIIEKRAKRRRKKKAPRPCISDGNFDGGRKVPSSLAPLVIYIGCCAHARYISERERKERGTVFYF